MGPNANRLSEALNGAALIGQPRSIGTVTLSLLENGQVVVSQTSFDVAMINLVLDKGKVNLLANTKLQIQGTVPLPPTQQ
jgi:hypothetical protein